MSAKTYSPEQEQEIIALYRSGETMDALAVAYGGKVHTISRVLKRHAEPSRGPAHHAAISAQMHDEIVSSYPRESQEVIARRLGIRQERVSSILRRAGIYDSERYVARRNNWRGGRAVRSDGYTQVLLSPDHPYRSMAGNSPYVLEHRLVMAQSLGRPLESHETVHHINGDKRDNRIENLQLRIGRHGNGTVMVCGDCGSPNVIHAQLAG